MKPKKKIRLIIFDISGTIIDHGSLATIYAFKSALSKYGIKITNDIIKIDMGIRKIDHLKKKLRQAKNNIPHYDKSMETNISYNCSVEFSYNI